FRLQVCRDSMYFASHADPRAASRYVARIVAETADPPDAIGALRIAAEGAPRPTVVHLAACESVVTHRDRLCSVAQTYVATCRNALRAIKDGNDARTIRLSQLLIDDAVDANTL